MPAVGRETMKDWESNTLCWVHCGNHLVNSYVPKDWPDIKGNHRCKWCAYGHLLTFYSFTPDTPLPHSSPTQMFYFLFES